MTYASWEPSPRVTTTTPGRLDIFVVTLVDGKLAKFDPISEYEAALERAQAFIKGHRVPIKVLCMSGPEFTNFAGIKPAERPEPIDFAERKALADMVLQIATDSSDPDARREAFALLKRMGVVKHD